MTSLLCICDQGYRATAEEQDDTVVWMAHMLQKADETTASLVLRGSAVGYVAAGGRSAPLRFGAWEQTHPPDIPRNIAAFQADGGRVYALAEDVQAHGYGAGDLIDGVVLVPASGLAELVASHDLVSFW